MSNSLDKGLVKNTIILLMLLALSTFTVPSLVQAAEEDLTKTVSSAPVGPNSTSSTMQWIVTHANNRPDLMENVILTDKMTNGHKLVAGSLQVPPGWSAQYSTDGGASFSSLQPPSSVDAMIFSNPFVVPTGRGVGREMTLPLSAGVSLSGAGDGYNAAITDSGKFVGLNHHQVGSGIWCYDSQTEAECPGYKKYPGINAGNTSSGVAIGEKVYFTNSTADGAYAQNGTIRCWDTETDSFCGDSPYIGAYAGPQAVNGLLYIVNQNGQVDCYDPTNHLQRCAGNWPQSIGLNAFSDPSTYSNGAELITVNKKIYISTLAQQLTCFDTQTQGKCVGWDTPKSTPGTSEIGSLTNAFLRLNAAGTTTGICARPADQTAATCWDLDGTPSAPLNITNGAGTFYYGYGLPYSEVYIGSRMLMGTYFTTAFSCWDFATNAPCTGKFYDASGQSTATDNGYAYALSTDGSCAYTYGDSGILKSWDPETGESPCRRSNGNLNVPMEKFRCDGIPDPSLQWDKVKFFDTNLTPNTDFTSLIVKVLDADTGEMLKGPLEMIGSNGEVDLADIPVSHKELSLISSGKPVGKAAWNDGVSPKVAMTFKSASPAQFCYTSTTACNTGGGIITKASLLDKMINTVRTNITPGLTVSTNVMACNIPPLLTAPSTLMFYTGSIATVLDAQSSDDIDREIADGTGLIYTLSGGADIALFNIDALGRLTFKTAPNIKKPLDTNKDNVYEVEIRVTDTGGATTAKLIQVTVIKDTDGDGVDDSRDLDRDGDGIPNSVEGSTDIDNDGIPNDYDLDSDADGIPDNIEAQATASFTAPSGVDANKDGVDDAYGTGLTPLNSDSADTPDYLDTNADNHGSNDTLEAGITLSGTDTDGDGLDDAIDKNNAAFGPANAGITNILATYPKSGTEASWRKANTAPVFTSPTAGTFNENSTAVALNVEVSDDKNKEADSTITYSIIGSDDDAQFNIAPKTGEISFKFAPDYEAPSDTNKDNAYTLTVKACDMEGGCTNQTFIINVVNVDEDRDGDGLLDSQEAFDPVNPGNSRDTDKDGIPDYLDNDDDGDGVLTQYEAPIAKRDTDNDGIPDYLDKDDDNDGILTADEQADPNKDGNPDDAVDKDSDGIPSYLDPEETPSVALQVRGILQGAYNSATGLMRDDLRKLGYIPSAQPYSNTSTSLGYTGTEMVAPALLANTDDDAPVDWVLVELRDKTNPKTRVAAIAAILQRDGDVVDPQTNATTLQVPNVVPGSYYVALRHRNHLGVMTQTAQLLSSNLTVTDFSHPGFAVSGTNARLVNGSVALLWGGDANNSNSLIANGPGNDTNALLGLVLTHPDNVQSNSNFRLNGYYSTDFNMDGVSLYSGPGNDINLLMGNVLLYPANKLFAANYVVNGGIPK